MAHCYKWDYKVIFVPSSTTSEELEKILKEEGKNGWENYAVIPVKNGFWLLFKKCIGYIAYYNLKSKVKEAKRRV